MLLMLVINTLNIASVNFIFMAMELMKIWFKQNVI
jgi:hypothetical protein